MGEKLLQNPSPRLLFILATYLDENEKLFFRLNRLNTIIRVKKMYY